MASYDYDLICIGSGPAGQRAAVQAAKLGHRVAVVERHGDLGGVCLTKGTIPSKTFREAVLAMTGSRHLVAEDAHPGPRPTARKLMARVDDVLRRESRVVEDQLHRNGVTMLPGEARFTDPHTIEVCSQKEKRSVTTNFVLIAVGTRPSPPPGIEVDGKRVFTSDQILDLEELPRTIAVVGAGIIGLEYASMFAALGIEVTLIDKRERLLEFVDHEIVDELVHQMRNANVTFRLTESVAKMQTQRQPPGRIVIELESGKRVVADSVLYSIGRSGATRALNLPAAGLETDDRGRLKVDGEFRTKVEHIYAAGDVIGFPALASTSSEQGRRAARFMFGAEATKMTEHMPIGIYAIPEISMVGATEETLTEQKVPYETGIARYREIARGQILGDSSGVFKMIFGRDDRSLLGVHAIGTGATELIHIGQAVLALGGGLDYFLRTVFNYPTLAECYKVAALDAHNKLSV